MDASFEHAVLVVDDDPEVRALYGAFLEPAYDVRLASAGSAALEAMSDEVDVVLLDRRMAGLSGRDVLHRLREDGYDQPVALVTAVEPDFDILRMGFDDYVTKPVGRQDLHDLVESLLLRRVYDDVIREYFSLVAKLTSLQQEKSVAELDGHEGYREANERLQAIKERARSALSAAIERGQFDRLLADLETGPAPTDYGISGGSVGADETAD